jgi:PAT family beta-lactamase induction signal transducer AmpG
MSPLMDATRCRAGRKRGWILLGQIALAASAWPWRRSERSLGRHGGRADAAVAFASASQDIAIDAYNGDTLKPEERPRGGSAHGDVTASLGIAGGAIISRA